MRGAARMVLHSPCALERPVPNARRPIHGRQDTRGARAVTRSGATRGHGALAALARDEGGQARVRDREGWGMTRSIEDEAVFTSDDGAIFGAAQGAVLSRDGCYCGASRCHQTPTQAEATPLWHRSLVPSNDWSPLQRTRGGCFARRRCDRYSALRIEDVQRRLNREVISGRDLRSFELRRSIEADIEDEDVRAWRDAGRRIHRYAGVAIPGVWPQSEEPDAVEQDARVIEFEPPREVDLCVKIERYRGGTHRRDVLGTRRARHVYVPSGRRGLRRRDACRERGHGGNDGHPAPRGHVEVHAANIAASATRVRFGVECDGDRVAHKDLIGRPVPMLLSNPSDSAARGITPLQRDPAVTPSSSEH
jgi:hypothetical protein